MQCASYEIPATSVSSLNFIRQSFITILTTFLINFSSVAILGLSECSELPMLVGPLYNSATQFATVAYEGENSL